MRQDLDAIDQLRGWLQLEHTQARKNIRDSVPAGAESFYHRYNQGREVALRSVIDKLHAILEPEMLTTVSVTSSGQRADSVLPVAG